MKIAVFFDIDDTLYNQVSPFERAFKQQFPTMIVDIEKVYMESRQLSDSVFAKTESGDLSMERMYIYRIQEAIRRFGFMISDDEALAFQEAYANFQKKIQLSLEIRSCLDFCQKNQMKIGIITNGPSKHQWDKIKALQLLNWVDKDSIFISSECGYAKPQVEIFDAARRSIPKGHSLYYIGDSYENDVKGSYHARWKAVWFNRRKRVATICTEQVGYDEIKTEKELFDYLQHLTD
ncbi:HAD family hydrolase [Streptococcus ovis]